MDRSRLEAFSDGVIAIAITLLVLDIKVPNARADGTQLAHELGRQWPSYVAFFVSFLTIGVVWMNHHATMRRLRAVDHILLSLNLLLLMAISILPWSTSLLAEHLLEIDGGRVAAAIYSGSFLFLTAVFYGMQRYILFGRSQLLAKHIDGATSRAIDHGGRLGLLPYLVGALVAAVSPYLTLAICGAVAVYYALPTTIYGQAQPDPLA